MAGKHSWKSCDADNLRLFGVGYNTESRITFHGRLFLLDFEYLDAAVGAAG
jgi:hypothetical protein